MKRNMTDLFDAVPVEMLESVVDEEKTGTVKKRRTLGGWTVAAAILGVCILSGCAGYAVFKYLDAYGSRFEEGEEKLAEGLVTEQSYRAEDGNYRVEVLSVLSDYEIKSILFSVEALNEESWVHMLSGRMFPRVFFDDRCAGGSIGYYEGKVDSGLNPGKRYYVLESTWEGAAEAKVVCMISPYEDPAKWGAGIADEEVLESGAVTVRVPLEPESELAVRVKPKETVFLRGAVLEEIVIRRTGIGLYGHGPQDVEMKETAEERDPEIIAGMRDGRRICLLLDNREALSMEVDEMWRKNRRGISSAAEEGEDTVQYHERIEFVHAFDVEQIERIWVDGKEYPTEE